MKTFSMIREDLKNIRYYYSRQKEMTNSARIVGESTILKTIEAYNAAICQASPKLYELYVCMYVENKTHEAAAEEFGYAREHITRLNKQLLRFLQNHLTV